MEIRQAMIIHSLFEELKEYYARSDVSEQIAGNVNAQKIINAAKEITGYSQKGLADNSKPLECIFNRISITGKRVNSSARYQPICSMNSDSYKNPTDSINDFEASSESNLKKFGEEASRPNSSNITTLFYLLKKYFWSHPSGVYEDVSLFEVLRLRAALTTCLYDYVVERTGSIENFDINIRDKEEKRFLLFCADITGIQKYIYNISHKRASKSLKGRSFHLQQILNSLADELLNRNSLPICNLVYSSGGKFYALLPNTNKAKNIVSEFDTDIQKKLFDEYQGELGIVCDYVELSANDFTDEKISLQWNELSKKVDRNKFRKFSSLFKDDFFEEKGFGGNIALCYATKKELCEKGNEKELIQQEKIFYEEESDRYLSREQYIAGETGKYLREAKFIVTDRFNKKEDSFSILDIGEYNLEKKLGNYSSQGVTALALNTDVLPDSKFKYSGGFTYYAGNWRLELDYDELMNKAHGLKRLGVLRMDVDNLGKIFTSGFNDDVNFFRVVQLSSALEYFFTSYINKLGELSWDAGEGIVDNGTEKLKDVMQIIYSGGDDLFIVGLWNMLPDIALWIKDEFAGFTGNNPDITLSAGISLFGSKFPLYKAAQDAGEAESMAKGIRINKDCSIKSKNAICFLETAMSWHDFEKVSKMVKELFTLIEEGKVVIKDGVKENVKLSRSIVNKLALIYSEFKTGHNELWAKWRWKACYSLSRFGKQYKDFEEEITSLSSKLFVNADMEQDLISLLNVIAGWTEYLTRKEDKK